MIYEEKLMAMLLSMALLGTLAGCGVTTTVPGGDTGSNKEIEEKTDVGSASGKTIEF